MRLVGKRLPWQRLLPVVGSGSSGALKTGLKVFVIPKNLGNPYFTLADSAKTGGTAPGCSTIYGTFQSDL